MKPLDIIVPVYNEKADIVADLLDAIDGAFDSSPTVTVFIVDDGSRPQFPRDVLKDRPNAQLIRHGSNKGYGEALKSGIRAGSAPWIAIIDADGTYPVANLPELVNEMHSADMVVGARTGTVCQIPFARRVPKKMLNYLASYMAGRTIRDLNSGMRVFTRELCEQLWPFFPRRFSFTSTLTMGALLGGYRIEERAVNYFKRSGNSAIHPVRDTLRFIHVILRMGTLFYPLKLFLPIAVALASVGFVKGFIRDLFVVGYIGNLSVMLILAGLQIFLMGYLGELIVTNRMWAGKKPPAGKK